MRLMNASTMADRNGRYNPGAYAMQMRGIALRNSRFNAMQNRADLDKRSGWRNVAAAFVAFLIPLVSACAGE